jgi:hypothetical protein
MPLETSFTVEDLVRIERAIVQGTRSVTFSDGRRVEYSTVEELIQRWHLIAKQLGVDAGRKRMFAEFRKGVVP